MLKIFRYIAAVLSAVVVSSALWAQTKTDGKTVDIDGIARFDRIIYDFGDVTLGQGALTCSFTVTNISQKPAVIYNVVSSWLYWGEMDPRAGASRQDRKDYCHIFQ